MMPRLTLPPRPAIALLCAACLVAFSRTAIGSEPPAVSFESLLAEMTDRDAVARWPEPSFRLMQASSWDRRSREGDLPSSDLSDEGWFANADFGKYLRTEHIGTRTEKVLMDAQGPGAIVRIWSANPEPGGTLRIYLDDSETPVIEESFKKLTDGTGPIAPPLSAVRSRGHNLYLPIPFARRCKVTLDADPENRVYYIINYRKYEEGADVRSLAAGDLEGHAEAIVRLQEDLLDTEIAVQRGAVGAISRANSRAVLRPGGNFSVLIGTGQMALRELTVTLEDLRGDAAERALRSLVLKIEADDEGTLVHAPLGDFFGSGVGINPYEDWYRTVREDGSMTCRWVMPFRQSMKLWIINQGQETASLSVRHTATAWEWDERSMYFRANFRQQRDIPTRPRQDFNFLEAQGQGVYIGDTLAVANPTPVWWGEGDEKVYVDGEAFPSHIGTGSEDYFGYAWCWPDPFMAPFHAQPRCDGPDNFGHTTNTRVRLLDGIPFNESYRFDMEVWHWQDVKVSYATTAYWYARPGARALGAAADEMDLAVPELPDMHRLADVVEGESLKILGKSGEFPVGAQMMFGAFDGNWSNGKHLWLRATEAGQWVDLELPTGGAGENQLVVWMTRAPDYGIVQLHVDGRPVGEPIDLYAEKVEPTGPLTVGAFRSRRETATLRIEIVGTNDQSSGARHFAALDAVRVE